MLFRSPINERSKFILQFDYHLDNKLICVNMTPIFISKDGKPWIVLCSTKISTNSSAGNATIYKTQSNNIWNYSTISNRWNKSESLTLSEIEKDVLRLSIQGKNEVEISQCIFRSIDGLRSLKRRLYRKLEVNNITEAVSFVISHGLI